jgi:hypothetical protein
VTTFLPGTFLIEHGAVGLGLTFPRPSTVYKLARHDHVVSIALSNPHAHAFVTNTMLFATTVLAAVGLAAAAPQYVPPPPGPPGGLGLNMTPEYVYKSDFDFQSLVSAFIY